MTVSNIIPKSGPEAGDNNNKTFSYTFDVLDVSHLVVIQTDAYGNEAVLTEDADYTVDLGTKQITLTATNAPTTDETITILRDLVVEQEKDFVFQSGYLPREHQEIFDRLTMIQQSQAEELNRAVKVSAASGSDPVGFTTDLENVRDAYARSRFERDHPTIQPPSKVIDFRIGHGESEITVDRSSVNHYTDANRVIVPGPANTARFRHSPAGVPEGLAIEPARTRLSLYPTEIENWAQSNVTTTADGSPSPDGRNAARKVEDTSSSVGNAHISTTIAEDDGHYMFSTYVLKRSSAPVVALQLELQGTTPVTRFVYLDPADGSIDGDGTVDIDYGIVDHARWWRVWIRAENNSTCTSAISHLIPAIRAAGSVSGPDNSALTGHNHFWGAMLERTDILAPVILGTEASQATTDGDNVTIDLAKAPWFNDVSGECTFLFEMSFDWIRSTFAAVAIEAASGKYARWNGGNSNDFVGTIEGTKRGDLSYCKFSPGGIWTSSPMPGNRTLGDHKILMAFDQNFVNMGFDGETPTIDHARLDTTPLTKLFLGQHVNSNITMIGTIQRISYWPRKLGQAEILAVTGT